MRPNDAHVERPNPVLGRTNDHVDRVIHHAGTYYGEVRGESPRVTINDVVQGPQEARAVALLGIDVKALDRAWYDFLTETLSYPVTGAPPREWLLFHQENSSWRVDVDIPENVDEVDDLAYIDGRAGKRWVTYSCRRWNSVMGVRDSSDPIPPGATFEVVTRQRPLDDVGAVGMSWFAVNEAEHKSTVAASAAILEAERNLRDALNEIEIADKVAKAAWKGPRAEAARFKFAVEYDVISAIRSVTAEWDSFMRELVSAQQDARKEDQQLLTDIRNEIGKEVAITATGAGIGAAVGGPPGAAVAGVATAAGRVSYRLLALTAKTLRVTAVTSKTRKFAESLRRSRWLQHNGFEKALKSVRRLRAFGIVAKTAALKAAAEGAKDFAARGVVNGVTGDGKKTLDDWWKSFVFAGLISGAGGKMFDDFAKRHDIDMDVAKNGATKEGAKGVVAAGAKEAFTNDPLVGGLVTAPLAGGARTTAIAAITRQLTNDGMGKEKARAIAEKAVDLPLSGIKAGATKGVDEYRKGPEESSDPQTPGERVSKPPVTR